MVEDMLELLSYFCHTVACYRLEAEPWLFTLNLEETLATENKLRPGPVKPQKAAL